MVELPRLFMGKFYNPFLVIDGTLVKCNGVFSNKYLSIGYSGEITKIGCLAFKGNPFIEHLFISKNVIDIDVEAFSCCPNLIDITVEEGNPRYSSMNGSNCIVDKETNCLILGCSTTKIPNTISSIGPFAFCGQTKITEIEIPSNIVKLSAFSFDGCKELKTVKINDGLEEIDECCFKGCHKLETIYVPITIVNIHNTAFSVLHDEESLLDDGDCLVHDIYFSGTKAELPQKFDVHKLFILSNNLSYNDMQFHCQDGEFVITNKE